MVTQFSNRYHFSGGTPSDTAHWTTLSDAVVTAEKAIFLPFATPGARIVETVGYAGGSEIPVFQKVYLTDGTLSATGGTPAVGDGAGLVRYATNDRSSKNHPVYCFNYYHAVKTNAPSALPDQVHASQVTAYSTYAASWLTGISDGTITVKRSRPNGNPCTGVLVASLVTHRDLPR